MLLLVDGPVGCQFAPTLASTVPEKDGACACLRKIAEDGLTRAQQLFEDAVVLGGGEFGIVHRQRCEKT